MYNHFTEVWIIKLITISLFIIISLSYYLNRQELYIINNFIIKYNFNKSCSELKYNIEKKWKV